MAVSKSNEQSILIRNSGIVFDLAVTAWNQFGDYLQRRHQARKNKKSYQRLLENDDYLLRDVGLSREIVQRMEQSSSNSNAELELQKRRWTSGRPL